MRRSMGAKEEMARTGREAENSRSSRVEQVMGKGMHRAASVDDLFAPLCGLNVHASGETPRSSSGPVAQRSHMSHVWSGTALGHSSRSAETPSAAPSSSASTSAFPEGPKADSESEQASASVQITSGGAVKSFLPRGQSPVSSSGTETEELSGPEANAHVFSEEGLQQQGADWRDSEAAGTFGGSAASGSAAQYNVIEAGGVESSLFPSGSYPAYRAGTTGVLPASKLESGRGGADPALPPSQSTSDDDQLNGSGLDERKQKRMLSNRESARRSRLRKQLHLDELRAQVALLRADNTDMMARYGIASQRYSQITAENVVLRTHAADLRLKLHQVHHELAAEHPNGLRPLGIQAGQLDQFSPGFPSYNL